MTTRLKDFRSALGLTQEDLATRVGVRRETVVFLEKGKYTPSLRLAYRTAKVLGLTIEQLFSFEDEEWEGASGEQRAR